VNAVVLKPFSFPDADRVVYLHETYKGNDGDVSAGSFSDWAEQSTQFDALGAIDWRNYVISSGDAPDRVLGAAVSHDYFRVFSAKPRLGRLFDEEDDRPGAARVTVLSSSAFEQRFGANASIVGRDIIVNGEPARVIGVLAADFDPLLANEQLFMPLQLTSADISARGSHYLDVIGRVKAGVSLASARRDLEQVAERSRALYPNEYDGRGISGTPIRDIILGDYRTRLFLLLGAVFVVLVIACANVANLLLARGAAREKEVAVRRALGAGGGRILRQLLTENLVLAIVTVIASLGLSSLGIRAITHFATSDIPRIVDTRIDLTVLAFALIVGAVSSLLFGLAPALRAARQDMQSTLRNGGRDTKGAIRDWLRSALVTAEVALSAVLLVGAGLLIRTSLKADHVKPGFRVEGVVTGSVTLPAQSYTDPDRSLAAFKRIVDQTATHAGISHAALSSLPPLSAGGNEMFLNAEGRAITHDNAAVARVRIISDDYFRALDIPIQRGRGFDTRDVRGAELVAVVSTQLAQTMWPGEDAIGKRFACCEGDDGHPVYKRVVGIAPDLHSRGPMLAPDPEFYIPLMQAPPDSWNWIGRSMTLVARGPAGQQAVIEAMRDAVHNTDANVPLYAVSSMQRQFDAATASARFNTLLLSLLGFLGLVLAATGIYGVVSYFVNLRTREIGVRIALGATTGSVLRLMTRQAMLPVAVGLAIGALAAVAGTRLLTASLVDVTPTDPLTFATVLAGLAIVALVAIVIPAWRASRVAPGEALLD
jgi:predicted permease